MSGAAVLLLAVGGILLLGLATDYLGGRTFLPRVTLLLLLGIALGDDVLGLIPAELSLRFDVIANVALMIIGFLIGGRLMLRTLKETGREVIGISLTAALVTAVLVTVALALAGVSLDVAILLGCIASATAPAATVDTVLENGRDSRFGAVLLAIVAVDDAWALILFSFGLSFVGLLNGAGGVLESGVDVVHEIGGGLLLGLLIGIPAAYLTGRIRKGQPMLTEALGLVLVCGGAALLLEVSLLISVMTMGAAISNLSTHHEYAFHEIENIERPFLAVFFVLAGAQLEFRELAIIGIVGVAYLIARMAGKIAGAWFGGAISGAPGPIKRWMGLAMLPQAGVPIGMALITADRFPEMADMILTTIVATTVVFDLVGPVMTRIAMERAELDKSADAL